LHAQPTLQKAIYSCHFNFEVSMDFSQRGFLADQTQRIKQKDVRRLVGDDAGAPAKLWLKKHGFSGNHFV
jgi:hypothetical protein